MRLKCEWSDWELKVQYDHEQCNALKIYESIYE